MSLDSEQDAPVTRRQDARRYDCLFSAISVSLRLCVFHPASPLLAIVPYGSLRADGHRLVGGVDLFLTFGLLVEVHVRLVVVVLQELVGKRHIEAHATRGTSVIDIPGAGNVLRYSVG